MNNPDSAHERIVHACRSLQAAMENWKADGLAGVESGRGLLQDAVADLQAVERDLPSGAMEAQGDLLCGLSELKHEIAKAVRLVDARLGFYRGVALRTVGTATCYGPAGAIGQVPDASAAAGIEG